jgi:uncharacterized protein
MLKVLIVALAVVVLLWLLFGRGRRRRDLPRRDAGTRAEDMVACAQCGLHLPRSDALAARGLHYCSRAHRDAAPPAAER